MARWDEILSLPVQNPPTLEFSAADLVWSKIEGWRDNIDRLALIPFVRVDDFLRGESANKDCPTRFHVEARRHRAPQASYKQKVDGILEYILYWCSFGPDDHRKGGIVRPSRTTYVPKKKNAGRPNTKRGCTCHFIVKRLIAEPSVALIIYNQDKHVDKKGLPCHGPQDKKAEGTRAMFAPYISEDLRLRVLSLLYVGVSVETIMQRHNETVERQGGPSNRDDLLTHRYVRRQERSIRRSTYELDADDAVSVSMWVESHQSHVFFYEDFSDSDPFILGIQTEWQLQQMIRFGNRSIMASDSRFGTNKLKYPVHSLVVFNSDKKAIPVAWIITPRFASNEAHRWMRALYNRVSAKDPSWKLAGFIVDDPSADILTIRDVFQCSVLISFWRVRHAWHKNIIKRCSEIEMCVQMSRRLEQAVNSICRGNGTVDLFDAFMEDFVDCTDFIDYFVAAWYPRIGMWVSALKNLPLASQETCAAMEFYHNQLKVRLLNEKKPVAYQRADWLVDKLGTKVHSYFWLDEYSEKDDFARYWKDEWVSGLTSWRKALEIPDTDVVMEDRSAKVVDQLDRDRVHVVWNPGSEYAICNCSWAEMGYLCEHVFKVIRLCHDKGCRKPSISLFQYNQALMDMLHCPPHDSLVRDHAISLAIAVQKQLDALVDFDTSQTTVDPAQKQAMDTFKQQRSEQYSANDHVDGQKGSGGLASDSGENTREETTITEMDIDRRHEASGGAASDSGRNTRVEGTCAEMDVDHRHKAPGGAAGDSGGNTREESACAEMDVDHRHKASGGARTDSGGNIRGENTCSMMDVDPSSITSSSPSKLVTVDKVYVRSVNKDKMVDFADLDTSKSLPSEVNTQTNQVGLEQDSVMDEEPLLTYAPISTSDSLEQSNVTNQDLCNDDPGALGIPNKLSDKTTSSLSKTAESEMIDVVETSCATRENEMAESVIENGSRTEHQCSTDNAFSSNRARGNNMDNCDVDSDAKAIESKVHSVSPTSSYDDKRPPVEVAVQETSSGDKPPLTSKFGLSVCSPLEKVAEHGKNDNEQLQS